MTKQEIDALRGSIAAVRMLMVVVINRGLVQEQRATLKSSMGELCNELRNNDDDYTKGLIATFDEVLEYINYESS